MSGHGGGCVDERDQEPPRDLGTVTDVASKIEKQKLARGREETCLLNRTSRSKRGNRGTSKPAHLEHKSQMRERRARRY